MKIKFNETTGVFSLTATTHKDKRKIRLMAAGLRNRRRAPHLDKNKLTIIL